MTHHLFSFDESIFALDPAAIAEAAIAEATRLDATAYRRRDESSVRCRAGAEESPVDAACEPCKAGAKLVLLGPDSDPELLSSPQEAYVPSTATVLRSTRPSDLEARPWAVSQTAAGGYAGGGVGFSTSGASAKKDSDALGTSAAASIFFAGFAAGDEEIAGLPCSQGSPLPSTGRRRPSFAHPTTAVATVPEVPEEDEDADDALAAADKVIESLCDGASMEPLDWLHPLLDSPSPLLGPIAAPDTLWFELTESPSAVGSHANADELDYEFGLSSNAVMGRIEEELNSHERIPLCLKYELTEDLGPHNLDWQDADFGLSDSQLEVLWKRFGARIADENAVLPQLGSPDCSSNCRSSPSSPSAKGNVQLSSMPCPDKLSGVEEVLESAGLTQLKDFLGENTLEQFIGEEVSSQAPLGLRAWMLSTRRIEGEDWYLFKVTDRCTNRFYMKTFADFEDLYKALKATTPENSGYQLPPLPVSDKLGIRRLFRGANFEIQRTKQLREFVEKLMSRIRSPSQEQILRLFFGPKARGQIFPPGVHGDAARLVESAPLASARMTLSSF
eukprot:TRINITY_DN42118_c0_g1_i1.p1 TRINITY_DN42118_c0_g1~~TRINITY_DN42118_c0_g1_i1.p1  ORF type:complete len:560 (+),score=116.64 TRINITY_DN42118_c0_g1_i1:286-1965(+)